MTNDQQNKCHIIIHTAAVGAAAGNIVPIPGTGIAADIIAMTAMVAGLAAVIGCSLATGVAEGLAITALKDTALKQPIKVLTKELSKLIPFAGQIIAPTISFGLIEAAGWSIAKQMDGEFCK